MTGLQIVLKPEKRTQSHAQLRRSCTVEQKDAIKLLYTVQTEYCISFEFGLEFGQLGTLDKMPVSITSSEALSSSLSDYQTTSSYSDLLSGSDTAASATATSSAVYPIFPKGWTAGLYTFDGSPTQLDIDLYNYCYLPYYFLTNYKRFEVTSSYPPRPTYLFDEAPCKRQASINTNCYFENTNRSFTGLQIPTSPEALAAQQRCYCKTYPFFDSAFGCQACLRDHGGIEGYHWYPEAYLSAFPSSYCAASTVTTDFYASYYQWSSTQTEVLVPTTTAPNVLGTQTDMSLYYTYNAHAVGTSSATSVANPIQPSLFIGVLALILGFA